MSEVLSRLQERCFVTGAGGFVGRRLVEAIGSGGVSDRRLDVCKDEGWRDALVDHDIVIHCAGVASSRGRAASEVEAVNVGGTVRVASFAREAGVRRFLFLSSVKVFGEFTEPGAVFSDESPLRPTSPYGESKARAEEELKQLHEPGAFEIVVLRPTVVVGPGLKGAVATMHRLSLIHI